MTEPITPERLQMIAEMLDRDRRVHPSGQYGRVEYVSREELAELVRGYVSVERASPSTGG